MHLWVFSWSSFFLKLSKVCMFICNSEWSLGLSVTEWLSCICVALWWTGDLSGLYTLVQSPLEMGTSYSFFFSPFIESRRWINGCLGFNFCNNLPFSCPSCSFCQKVCLWVLQSKLWSVRIWSHPVLSVCYNVQVLLLKPQQFYSERFDGLGALLPVKQSWWCVCVCVFVCEREWKVVLHL